MAIIKPKYLNKSFFSDLKKVLRIFWNSNKTVFISSVLLTLVLGLFPIALSYLYKLVLDKVVADTAAKVLSIALISIFSFRYLVSYFSVIINSFLYTYLDRTFKYDVERYTTIQFAEKASQLDMAYLDDAESANLYKKRFKHILIESLILAQICFTALQTSSLS